MLILSVAENLDELFQNGGLAAVAALSELSGVVEMTINLTLMFVVGILGAEYCRTN